MPAQRIVSRAQMEIIISFMSQHRDFANCKLNRSNKATAAILWDELATQLSDVRDGTKKSGELWRRYWAERKYNVRKKAKLIQQQLSAGEPCRMKLTDEEMKIYDVIGRMSDKAEPCNMIPFPEEDSSQSGPSDPLSNFDKFLTNETPQKESVTIKEYKEPKQLESKPEILNHIQLSANEDTDAVFEKTCEGFAPGSSENLPLIDTLAATEVFMTFPDEDKLLMRELWRRPTELLSDFIGYVQVRRDETCTVKCVVATKTTSNHCTITYDEANHIVVKTICDCGKLYCCHVMTVLIWLTRSVGPGTYWLQPMVTRDPSTMRIGAIFQFPQQELSPPKFDLFNEFVKLCKENKFYTPAIMKYHYEDERTKASLHQLICKYKKSFQTDVDAFLELCKENITEQDCDGALESTLELGVKQELIYGRITDDILHEATRKERNVEGLIEKITLPDPKERVDVRAEVIESLEKSLKMKMNKCGLIISKNYPIFAASPYGTTTTHVIHIERITESSDKYSGVKVTPEVHACMQLQMLLAKKEIGCFCIVHETNRIDVMIVKYNKTVIKELIKKATNFWKTFVFNRINMENAK